jgi:hypothetical protein
MQKKVNILVNIKSTAIKCPKISLITNFSNKNTNTIAPLYKRLLEIVCESLRERILFPFFQLRQIPKQVSKIIEVTANKTKGFIGAKIVSGASRNNLVFIILYKILECQNYNKFPFHLDFLRYTFAQLQLDRLKLGYQISQIVPC